MAPPTGTLTVTLRIWNQGDRFYACDCGNQFLQAPISGTSRGEAIVKAQAAIQTELRRWAEVYEPYYVEELASQPIRWNYQ